MYLCEGIIPVECCQKFYSNKPMIFVIIFHVSSVIDFFL